ncbi:glycosyl hydrolase family 47-domain-containing protein [Microdochium trichocladiopsis]|uniref:alpha-1,2-Mannosidase n=1 Tax=Microdochium trichocladiopsis TaxID=1682393 RepID=A0A9P8Y671_9PEZI|nr:glycosyl hydrolase family 47-domain-containing protein [Microdochium trichocladiopsis]KAH7029143.1 glycosyl hydrolase family 47-domain-containing protein [Microdochium trichocladiopsis]
MRGFRRYRAFVLFAAITLFVLYRFSFSSEDAWESFSNTGSPALNKIPPKAPGPNYGTSDHSHPTVDKTDDRPAAKEQIPPKPKLEDDPRKPAIPDLPGVAHDGSDADTYNPHSAVTPGKSSSDLASSDAGDDDDHTSLIKQKPASGGKPDKAKGNTAHDDTLNIPDRIIDQTRPGSGSDSDYDSAGDLLSAGVGPASTSSGTHWQKPTEHFPIPTESIIPLPTGKPVDIPTIQHAFGKETAEAQKLRETRLAKVKAEAVRAWKGYRKYAFGHDELSPVTKRFRDPFCGWAATLVDSLDTLWIMGLKEEFEEALEAVAKIDFTVTPKTETPVFETTIRYLGGLLAAYDVSGGKTVSSHKILLDKAVELAEILMGVFDTPNRMPILFYNWRPAAMEKAKRASSSSNLAELGSLSMEFTRLAQLTKEDKYYDAIDRITNAFEEWQNRGTSLPGIFPDRVDAAGCNRTAEAERATERQNEAAARAQQSTPKSSTYLDKSDDRAHAKGFSVDEDELAVSNHNHQDPVPGKSPVGGSRNNAEGSSGSGLQRRSNYAAEHWDPTGLSSTSEPECIPQGLAPGGYSEAYGMGGGQDSTYEYFPKQYLLLGGLEPKYKAMHQKVAAAVKKWLLYRPMVPDNRDLLFSAKLTTRGNPLEDANTEYEVTHLTCFLGGMFGMAGKIFDEPDDVEIGKRLADGCVWAYESMPSGIMPEGAYVVPCANVKKCEFNETLWWEHLDPLAAMRDAQLADYYKRVEELKALRLKQGHAEEDEEPTGHKLHVGHSSSASSHSDDDDDDESEEGLSGSASLDMTQRVHANKLEANSDSADSDDSNLVKRSPMPPPESRTNAEWASSVSANHAAKGMLADDDEEIPLDMTLPARPQSHKEFVQSRIQREKLPPGFTDVRFASYILRPEAIESVWYMYRITGDTTWQDKGWKMFEAIIRHTQTEAGHSAIHDVMRSNPDKKDEMESFWLAETLKYFFLLYSTPDVISLDEWVLNTEAHPFRRPS